MNIPQALRQMPQGQRRAGKALLSFLGLMMAFTVLSRGLDAFTIARVAVSAPSYGALTYQVLLQGYTAVGTEAAVTLPAGFPVQELYLREGERIEAGDPVALLDVDAIRQKLKQAQTQLEDARLTAAADRIRTEMPQTNDPLESARLRLERAEQDAKSADKAASAAIARAESDLRLAQRERRKLLDEDDYTDAELSAVQQEVSAAGYAVDDAIRAGEQADKDAQREIQDAQRGVTEAQRQQQAADQTDAAQQESQRLAGGRHALTMEEKQAAVAELQTLLEEEGRITAQQGGIVTGVRIQTGEITAVGGAFLLSGQGGCVFHAQATKEEAARMAPGDRIELTLSGHSSVVDGQISSIQPPQNPGDTYTITVQLPDVDLPPDQPGTLSAVKRSSQETTLVPLSALYTENSKDRGYVFVLRERSTTMGSQLAVERLAVDILDRGKAMASVQASFAPDDRIVTASSRFLTDGDRVRVEGKG